MTSRICRDDERDEILSIINAAAEAYHGVISADCWHDPYMSGDELDRELATVSRASKSARQLVARREWCVLTIWQNNEATSVCTRVKVDAAANTVMVLS
jgi:hypothetical protein